MAGQSCWSPARTSPSARKLENALRQSEAYLAQAQELSHTGSFGWRSATGEITWSKETYRIFQCDEDDQATNPLHAQRIHPDDRLAVQQTAGRAAREARDYDHEYRLVMPDGSIKYVRAVARATRIPAAGRSSSDGNRRHGDQRGRAKAS